MFTFAEINYVLYNISGVAEGISFNSVASNLGLK